ncbi:hypothetical protein GOP47_0016399 [Adiantum capillus-veneris]|uniref:pectinesterase n=1 Tax=Adiantum capillus-veneris TaxID=13818 RepID=A0A9D4UIF2_ADICA|nr:hypothetical protein GOP47_0016399 [Adiantum capillus-veneris]
MGGRCTITGTGSGSPYMHLGRPWAPHARVIFAYTWMDSCIVPSGWNNWGNPENEKTACYYEYRCSGPGSNLSKRVPWVKQLRDEDVAVLHNIYCCIKHKKEQIHSETSEDISIYGWKKGRVLRDFVSVAISHASFYSRGFGKGNIIDHGS